MSDKKQEITADVLIADVMLRITAIEKLLLDKNIISKEELIKCTEEIASKISQVLLEKVKAAKDTAELMSNLANNEKKN